jgi:hypothetical protein
VLRACPSCTFELNRVETHLPRGEIVFSQIRWTQGNVLNTRVDAFAEEVKIRVSLGFEVNHVELAGLRVLVQEGDGRAASEPDSVEGRSEKNTLQIKTIEFSDAQFEYRRIDPTRDAVIRVSEIQGRVISVREAQGTLRVQALATGLLEQSGRFRLELDFPTFDSLLLESSFAMEVDLILRGQKLDQLNPYFDSHNGIHLSGLLYEGQSHVSIQNRQARVATRVRYDGLGILFRKNQKRGATAAWASNWVGSFRLIKSNLKLKAQVSPERATLSQNPNETVLQMILRAMKVTALSAVTR